MKILFTIVIQLLFIISSIAAVPPSELKCTALQEWLKANTYDNIHVTLGYTEARKKMYSIIDNSNDSIECVYGGFKVFNQRGNEITFPNPINTEHTIPQSLFNSLDPMLSDIHHLYPSFQDWNTERGNNRFADIPDGSTTKWMYKNTSRSSIPPSNINAYSESNGTVFEPRESHKGNVARSLFYFYTMYQNTGSEITDVANVSTLLAWHILDPVDAKEILRNQEAALYQGNENPYISMPELVDRAWGSGCFIGTKDIIPSPKNEILNCQINPSGKIIRLTFKSELTKDAKLNVYDMTGRNISSARLVSLGGNSYEVNANIGDCSPAIYIFNISNGEVVPYKFYKQ